MKQDFFNTYTCRNNAENRYINSWSGWITTKRMFGQTCEENIMFI
jgi:hypothetical protein